MIWLPDFGAAPADFSVFWDSRLAAVLYSRFPAPAWECILAASSPPFAANRPPPKYTFRAVIPAQAGIQNSSRKPQRPQYPAHAVFAASMHSPAGAWERERKRPHSGASRNLRKKGAAFFLPYFSCRNLFRHGLILRIIYYPPFIRLGGNKLPCKCVLK